MRNNTELALRPYGLKHTMILNLWIDCDDLAVWCCCDEEDEKELLTCWMQRPKGSAPATGSLSCGGVAAACRPRATTPEL